MGICEECNEHAPWGWCKPRNSKHFKNNFYKWTSGNEKIDKFIWDAQLNTNSLYAAIEWILYNRFKYIKEIAKGGFSTIYYAKWIDGYIKRWDTKKKQWNRNGKLEVVLKKFDNFANLNEDFLNEMTIHLKTMDIKSYSIRIYGITKDPKTNRYMMIRYGDFHPGNILANDFKTRALLISDFGLSKIVGKSLENSNKRNIFGVLPYVAPEVLCGEENTKAADVYSFGIVTYELPHDRDLARQICDGLRPKIPFHTPKLITRIIMRCWDARVTHRPTFKELEKELWKYHYYYKDNGYKNNYEITFQILKAAKFSKHLNNTMNPYNYQTHPEAIYTSRLLNYSGLPKPKNGENFEKELEETTKSTFASSVIASGPIKVC
ncbi:hypothetical protein Glove_21g72 [Diversispora epigaea]|uniref:Protein kinase domain-containing protein n=1 Tax=Diversispora epigaea TaxID=1348612 RepID=A0A397JKD7_9GLOM|nr:hypothetical protein Glove_21g72 [Diversispora epigaea]